MKRLHLSPRREEIHDGSALDDSRPDDRPHGPGFFAKLRARRAEAIQKANADHPDLAPTDVIDKRLARRTSMLLTGLVAVLLISAAVQLGRNIIGVRMNRVGYAWLTPAADPPGTLFPAVAVDFKDRFKKDDGSTDYAALDRLVGGVINLGAKAVIVDYDFGIDPNGHKSTGGEVVAERTWHDPTPPIYLVSFSAGLPKKYWLNEGNPEYAVHPFLPSGTRPGVVYQTGALSLGGEPAMPSMMDVLAELSPQNAPNWLIEQVCTDMSPVEIQPAYGHAVHSEAPAYLLNRATLDQVRNDAVDYSKQDLANIPSDEFMGRIVVIGSSTAATDVHGGSAQAAHSLVDLYAATAASAAFGGERLHFLKPAVAFALNIVTGWAIVLAVYMALRARIHEELRFSMGRLACITSVLSAAAVVAFGLGLARVLNVMWMDFFVVAPVAALHPIIPRLAWTRKPRAARPVRKVSSELANIAVQALVCEGSTGDNSLAPAVSPQAAPLAAMAVDVQPANLEPANPRPVGEPIRYTQPAVTPTVKSHPVKKRIVEPHPENTASVGDGLACRQTFKRHPVKRRPINLSESGMQPA